MAASGKVKVPTHPLVEALNPDPAKPPQRTVKLLGLPGPAPDAGHTRLWLDEALTAYVDVPNDAILYSKTLPDDAGTVLWVAADAPLTHGSVSSHETQASFLAGAITASHLAGAAGVAGPSPRLVTGPTACPSGCAPCPTLAPCMTEACPPTYPGPCLSHVPCPSVAPCMTEACPPTHLGPCLSSPWVCRVTNVPPCPLLSQACGPPTLAPACAPSVQVICPPPSAVGGCGQSVHLICPTPSAVGGCGQSVHVICPPPSAVGGCGQSVDLICPTPSAVGGCGQSTPVFCAIPTGGTFCPTPSAFGCPSLACGGGQPGGGGLAGQ
jgi:hypothetical protein